MTERELKLLQRKFKAPATTKLREDPKRYNPTKKETKMVKDIAKYLTKIEDKE